VGSIIEINDTLRITRDQGFPGDHLNLTTHLLDPCKIEDVGEWRFKFHSKSGIRVYQQPPIRNFLVEAIDDKWVYWGLCHIIEVTHNYEKATTSGWFQVVYLNSPDEMRAAFDLVDQVAASNYFS
jgi:hypothetical protein